MARGGTRRGPSSLQYASPSATKTSLFFLAPFSTFFFPPFPDPPPPSTGGASTTGGGFDAQAVYGGPCTALGNEGRAMPRETLAGAARGRGKGGQPQPLMTMIHMAIHRLAKIHDTRESTSSTLICYYSLPPPMLKDMPASAGPWGLAVSTSSRPKGAPPEPRIRGERLWTWVRL